MIIFSIILFYFVFVVDVVHFVFIGIVVNFVEADLKSDENIVLCVFSFIEL